MGSGPSAAATNQRHMLSPDRHPDSGRHMT